MPSVIGRPVAEARLVLEEAGAEVVEVSETAPPGGALGGPLRVVRERWGGDGVHLVVAASRGLPERDDPDASQE